jgi:phosphoenolpyruvate synthase/pyruvate phosphate dikinase
MTAYKYIRWFEEVGIGDVPLVGGKNASLGEMYRKLGDQGVLIPNGFATTADAYRYALEAAGALEIYAMCEIPNNVLLIDEFAKTVDGFSIGSNDLTQLTLGVDRDSALVAFDYDERDEGVKLMIKLAVEGCARNRIHSGLCGQAPSDYPDMAVYLVEIGIDSLSLNPDTVIKTTLRILELEQRLSAGQRAA